MRTAAPLLLALLLPAAAQAQLAPTPSMEDPRLQTVVHDPALPVRLVAFPSATLTVMLLPGDRIERVAVSDTNAFEVKITGPADGLNIDARRPGATATLVVETQGRRYEFDLVTGEGLAAAYLVRFVDPGLPPMPPSNAPIPFPPTAPDPAAAVTATYRLSGERALRPTLIADDGVRTWLEWGEYQSLPAVFGIGPTGAEEVVDGYMREGRFIIDRIYSELVFRIDRKNAKARRVNPGARR